MRFHWLVVMRMASVLALAPAASAQLMRVTGEGSLEHLENGGTAPAFLPGLAEVRFDFRLGSVANDEHVSYPASASLLQIGGEQIVLQNAVLDVWRRRSEADPFTSYLLRGETRDGWWFSMQNDFARADETLGFPRLLVPPGDLLVHDVTLRAGDFSWAGYGDGVITSIQVVPAPEPATYAFSAAAVLGVSILLRRRGRWRART